MRVNKFHILLWLMLACTSCIEPFDPDIREQQDFMVINGMISDRPGIQKVTISRSSPYNDPEFRPVNNCVVAVEDNEGNMAYYYSAGNGEYRADLGPPFLAVGKSYSLIVETPYREQYRSDFDTLLACPEVDSVYFMENISGGTDPDTEYQGVQFYNDVRGTKGGARNFRWIATATWEYRSPYSPMYVWHYGGLQLVEPADTNYTCYRTETIQSVYAASTRFLTENSIYQNKLHYVSDQSPRLAHRYSLLVEQHALTEAAYRYWEKLSVQSTRTESFYETQPSSIEGNMYNVNNEWERVLGCFYASQVREKRIFVDREDISFRVMDYTCVLDTIQDFSHFVYDNYYYLISLALFPPGPPYLTGDNNCFDCTQRGGVAVVPDYW